MASIHKRRGGWRVRWRDPDGRSRSRQFATQREAKAHVRAVEEAGARGERWEPRDARREPTTVGILEAFLIARSLSRSPNTIRNYGSRLQRFASWLGPRKQRPPREVLSRATLRAFWASLGDLKVSSRRVIVGTVQQAWEWAYDDEDHGWAIPRPRTIEMPTVAGAPRPAPSWSEMDAVIAELDGWRRRSAIVQRCTGLRVGQAHRLEWRDVDLDAATVTIRGELGKTRQERRGRVIPIAPVLVAELATWGRREGRLVPRSHQEVRPLIAAWERAKVPRAAWEGRPNHAFRHGFQTGLRAAGVDPDAIKALVGHSRGIQDVYVSAGSLGLEDAVKLVPPIGGVVEHVVPLRRRGDG